MFSFIVANLKVSKNGPNFRLIHYVIMICLFFTIDTTASRRHIHEAEVVEELYKLVEVCEALFCLRS